MGISMRTTTFAIAASLTIAATLAGDAGAKPRRPKRRVTKEPPIAFYIAEWGNVKEATREAAVKACRARRAAEAKAHPELAGYRDKPCEDGVVTVRGPYDRRGARMDGYDDPRVHVYRGSDGGWYDANGWSSCFVSGTQVATPDGERPIESLRVGDVVWSWDLAEERLVRGVVERTKQRVAPRVDTIVAGGAAVTATPNHPFFSVRARTWVELGALGRDDAVMVLDGTRLAARALDAPVAAPTGGATGGGHAFVVHDITVSPHRNYFAGGVLVHNY
jgi:hypothetical protein